MRPGQTAKGSFKNSKSKGKTQVFVPIDYIRAFCFEIGQKLKAIKTQNQKTHAWAQAQACLNTKKLALFAYTFLDIFT